MKIIDPKNLSKEEALELYKLYVNSEMALLTANGDERIPLETKIKNGKLIRQSCIKLC